MTIDEALARLQALGSEKVRQMNARNGAGGNQYGVKMGDLRTLAKEIKIDHDLAMSLWDTGNVDAMLLAILVMRPKQLSIDDLERMVRSFTYNWLADWFSSYIVKIHPDKEKLRQPWMDSDVPMAARMGWSLTAERVAKAPEGLNLVALLDRIEREMGSAHELVQWTMNSTLATIGIHHAEHRARALAIGEKLGVYRDFPCSKGCTSPFAPIWIAEMVSRQS